ncbi:glyoxal oxidase-related protein [Melia azedarach]|uniref:Glyoxal oxidase-related protein n=1 Tax=Melia azedarach TaxID=155640 RepID=A0ACC1YS30_MELAZ|nr:glyoxal oxidase-related protein [Melia azedarach]
MQTKAIDSTMARTFRAVYILPLLFISGHAHFFFQNHFFKFPDPFSRFRHEPRGSADESSESKNTNITSGYNGEWELVSENSGVSSMHAILLPKINKVLMYDATIWKISKIPLPPHKMPCRIADHTTGELDCWCHSVLFDIETSKLKALEGIHIQYIFILQTDTWCSSGGLTVDGNLVSAGGNGGGANAVRYLSTCPTCDWREYSTALADPRWYSTQVTLPDGGFIVVGGRGAFSYEYIPPEGQSNKKALFLPLMQNTHDQLRGVDGQIFFTLENNLYPFVHLSPDGNLFIFSNNRSILLDPASNKVVREFPDLPGGSRNYPASGMSALLPIKNAKAVSAEVLICGGAKWDSFYFAETQKQFLPALQDCGTIKITEQNPNWKIEQMPSPRVMGDIMILPTGDLLMLNGAKTGTSAWNDAEDPNFVPVLYRPNAAEHERFKELAATTIPRMYHSSAVLLPDGKVLVAGSNTNDGYEFDVKYPTELRVEKFSPSYLDPSLAQLRPHIIVESSDKLINYGKRLSVRVRSKEMILNKDEVEVTMYAPAFTTHGISMNQRLIILNLVDVINNVWPGVHSIIAEAPLSGAVAPPGYYLLYVVYKGVPSVAMWVQIK